MIDFFKAIRRLLVRTFTKAFEDNLPLHGAAIAFYTIFSLAPLAIILISLSGLLLGKTTSSQEVQHYLEMLTTPDLARAITRIIQKAGNESHSVIASVVGTITLLFGATTVITQMKNTLNHIWSVSATKINTIGQYLLDRGIALIMILVVTLIFLTSLLLEGLLGLLSQKLLQLIPLRLLQWAQIGTGSLNLILAFAFFASLFKLLPDIKPRWRDIFVGSAFTTVLFLIGKSLIGWYITSASFQASYQAAGSFVIFLIWVYYNVQIILVGAEFTRVYTQSHGGDVNTAWNAEWIEPLK